MEEFSQNKAAMTKAKRLVSKQESQMVRWGSGSEIGSKVGSESVEPVLFRHVRVLSHLLVEATGSRVPGPLYPGCFGCV